MAYPEGAQTLKLDPTRDYVLRLPTGRALQNSYGLTITGGHNVVVVGGAVSVGSGFTASGEVRRRGAYFKDQTGTMFLEGVRFLSPTNSQLTEGIDLSQSKGAAVIIQNVVIEHLSGSYATNHADGIQTWAGPRMLLMDRVSIDTSYQGMFLLPNQHYSGPKPTLWDFRRVDIHGTSGAGYMLWRDRQDYPFHTSQVFAHVDGRTGTNKMLWPSVSDPAFVGISLAAPALKFGSQAGASYATVGYN